MDLTAESCAPCKAKGGTAVLLSSDEVQLLSAAICPTWKLADEGKAIERRFVARNFQAALDWVVAAGALAEQEGHHPDLHITSYRNVCVRVSTHSVNGLCRNDFILAAKLDIIPVNYSPKFVKNTPGLTAGRNREEVQKEA